MGDTGSFTLTLPATWIIEIEVDLVRHKGEAAVTMPVLISGSAVEIDLNGIISSRKKVEQLAGRIQGAITKAVNRKIDKGEIGVRP